MNSDSQPTTITKGDKRMNVVKIKGTIAAAPKPVNEEITSEPFYVMPVEVPRRSGVVDTVQVLTFTNMFRAGETIALNGIIRSFFSGNPEEGRKLYLYVQLREILPPESVADGTNYVAFTGYLRGSRRLRQTPLGKNIFDFAVFANSPHVIRTYVPCIAWNSMAKILEREVAYARDGKDNLVKVEGRFQSRIYEKDSVLCTTYELSVSNVSYISVPDKTENATVNSPVPGAVRMEAPIDNEHIPGAVHMDTPIDTGFVPGPLQVDPM